MSAYIKSIWIHGFKKFKEFQMDFNDKMNILVGENEAGKSTILEAIQLVLNQDYRHADKIVLEDLFNKDNIENFISHPSVETLPSMAVEIVLQMGDKEAYSQFYFGEHNHKKQCLFGISFKCEFDVEQWGNLFNWSEQTSVPYEYYTMTWNTFSGAPYSLLRRPLHFLALDVTKQDRVKSFNYYNRTVFNSALDENTRLHLKNKFRSSLSEAFGKRIIDSVANRTLGIDSRKVLLENIISVFENDVPLESHGSGMESLVKTQIALTKGADFNVILLEEPENHLSFINLQKMVEMISSQQENSQIILATHSSMIASRLDLQNISWITDGSAKSLREVKKEDAHFFERLPNNNLLQLLLSNKALLVEGPTEYLLFPAFYEAITGKSFKQSGIAIISCNGISYQRYLNIAQVAQKKVGVLTDNDKKAEKIKQIAKQNQELAKKGNLQHVFTDDDCEHWTWEVCLFSANSDSIKRYFRDELRPRISKYDDESCMTYMNNHKAEFAYHLLEDDVIERYEIKAPGYIVEAIKWLEK